MKEPTTIQELYEFHMKDMEVLNKNITNNEEFHAAIRDLCLYGLGVDIKDPKSILAFRAQHESLIEQRNRLIRLQVWVGRAVIALCVTGIGAIMDHIIKIWGSKP